MTICKDGSSESKVQLEIEEPRNSRVHAFCFEFLREVFQLVFEQFGSRGIVVGDDDGVFVDPQISVESSKEVLGEVFCAVLGIGGTQSFSQLV